MPLATPLITVLTTVKNGAPFLPRTIDSVLNQTLDDWEMIVVDDASDDGTLDILRRYAHGDERITFIARSTSGGPYVAANEGLAVAKGKYVARLDGDDLAVPERLATQLMFLESEPSLRACAGGWLEVDADDRPISGPRAVPSRSSNVLRWLLAPSGGLVHSTALVRRDAFIEVGGYAELPVSADYGLWCQLARRGWLGVVPDVVVHWRKHERQISAERLDEQLATGAGLLGEHLLAMTGEEWSHPDLVALRGVGRFQDVDARHGIDVLDRWERLWRADPTLTSSDRRELARWGLRIRLRHVKRNRAGSFTLPLRAMARWAVLAASRR